MITIGLMSGTSVDGVDAALCEFSDDNTVRLLGTHYQAYDQNLKQRIHALCATEDPATDDLDIVDEALVQIFHEAVVGLLVKTAVTSDSVAAIGSHGQTIRHCPECDPPYSLQIGDPRKLAALSGITTIGDFRSADIQAGGQGAPLAPAFHNAVFRSEESDRVILNLGGIANITLLPRDLSQRVIGFDTGPGNTLLDTWSRLCLHQDYDADGAWSASGKLNQALLTNMLAEPYFALPAPKSTGRELFSQDWLERQLLQHSGLQQQDVATTLVELTAISIADAINSHASAVKEIFVCGGGTHNRYLLGRIQARLGDRRLATTEELGIEPDWVEAAAFAWLAKQALEQKPGNLPAVTGARAAVILGTICRP